MKFVSVVMASLLLFSVTVSADETGKEKLFAGSVALLTGIALQRQSSVYAERAASRSSAIQSRKSKKFELGSALCFVSSVLLFSSNMLDVKTDGDAVVVEKKIKF